MVTPSLYLVTHVFDGDYGGYRAVDLGLQTLNVAVLGYLVWRLTGASRVITVAAMTAAAASRFAAFALLQGYGVMESTALLFVLLTVIAVERAVARRQWRWLAIANLGFALAEFSHERFILLGPFLVMAALVAPIRPVRRAARAGWVALPLLVAFANYAVKEWALHIRFFTGGGGLSESFSLTQTIRFAGDGLASIAGYNVGPDYLSGRDAASAGATGLLVALAFAIPLGAALLLGFARDLGAGGGGERRLALRRALLAGSLIVPLLLSASITFRQEYRWLYAPFLVLIAGVSWALGRIRPPALAWGAIALVFGGSLVVDGYYHRFIANTYFFASQSRADAVRSQVIDAHHPDLATTTFVFVSADPTFAQFDLGGGLIFAVYAPGADVDARFVADLPAVCRIGPRRGRLVVYSVGQSEITELSGAATGCA